MTKWVRSKRLSNGVLKLIATYTIAPSYDQKPDVCALYISIQRSAMHCFAISIPAGSRLVRTIRVRIIWDAPCPSIASTRSASLRWVSHTRFA